MSVSELLLYAYNHDQLLHITSKLNRLNYIEKMEKFYIDPKSEVIELKLKASILVGSGEDEEGDGDMNGGGTF